MIKDFIHAIADTDIGIVWLIGVAVGVYGWQYAPWRGPPIHVTSLSAEAVATPAGYDLVLSYDIDKFRACPSQLSRIIVSESGEMRQLQPTIGSMNPVGHSRGKLRLQLPNMQPGLYTFRTTATYDCSDRTWITVTPPAAFSIPPPSKPEARPGR